MNCQTSKNSCILSGDSHKESQQIKSSKMTEITFPCTYISYHFIRSLKSFLSSSSCSKIPKFSQADIFLALSISCFNLHNRDMSGETYVLTVFFDAAVLLYGKGLGQLGQTLVDAPAAPERLGEPALQPLQRHGFVDPTCK